MPINPLAKAKKSVKAPQNRRSEVAKMHNIGQIRWNPDRNEAEKQYLRYAIEVIALYDLESELESLPQKIARDYLKGEMNSSERDRCHDDIWTRIEDRWKSGRTEIRENARIRIGLMLPPNFAHDDLGERLEWLPQFIYTLGYSMRAESELMQTYFEFDV